MHAAVVFFLLKKPVFSLFIFLEPEEMENSATVSDLCLFVSLFCSLLQGPQGRSGLPGLPGADGPPVRALYTHTATSFCNSIHFVLEPTLQPLSHPKIPILFRLNIKKGSVKLLRYP